MTPVRLSYRAFLIPRLAAAALLLAALLGGGGTIAMPVWMPGVLFLVAGAIVTALIVTGMRIKMAADARSVVDTLPDETAHRIWTAVRGQDRARVKALLQEAGVGADRIGWVARHLTTRPTKI